MPYKDPIKRREHAIGRVKKYRLLHPDRIESGRLKYRFGISLETYNALLQSQNGVCAVCGLPETMQNQHKVKKLAVDHDHKTGKIRGLLCNGCNTGLGFIGENTSTLKKMIEYINKHK